LKVQRVIITGGPSTGKTSIINKLEDSGFNCKHEMSRDIIQDALRNNSDCVPWLNVLKFSKTVIAQREAQYHSVKSKKSKKYTFFDRGIPDVYAYMEYDDLDIPIDFLKLGNELRYHSKIFLTPAWKEIYENDAERKEDFYKAKQLQQYIHNTYKDLGYDVIIVPKANVEERIKFILKHLEN